MNGQRLYNFILHLAVWAAFFLLVVSLAPKPHFHPELPTPPFPPFFLLLFPALAGFYYLNSLLLIPQLLARHSRLVYVLCVAAFCCVIVLIPSAEHAFLNPDKPPLPPEIDSIHILISLLLFLLVLIASSGSDIVRYWFAAEERKKEIEFEKTTTELSFLKSQINPHFLFNTLNNIYTLSILKPEQASDAILKLADLMRYVFTDPGQKAVPMVEELGYLEKFIDLQKLRLTQNVTIDFQTFGEPDGKKIAPLLLLPFIENAFKYGVSTHLKSTIQIHLFFKEDQIVLQTKNSIFDQSNEHIISTGIGLANVERRLQLLYPNLHWLRIETIDDFYFIDLQILI